MIIKDVVVRENGSGVLRLAEYQASYTFAKAPSFIALLKGMTLVLDGEDVYLGNIKIAKAKGYSKIEFLDDEILKKAIVNLHVVRRAE